MSRSWLNKVHKKSFKQLCWLPLSTGMKSTVGPPAYIYYNDMIPADPDRVRFL